MLADESDDIFVDIFALNDNHATRGAARLEIEFVMGDDVDVHRNVSYDCIDRRYRIPIQLHIRHRVEVVTNAFIWSESLLRSTVYYLDPRIGVVLESLWLKLLVLQ